jgi:IS30 family transposase
MLRLPQHLLKILTWDRGEETSAYNAFTPDTDMSVYFCDPNSPRQHGTNENTNGFLPQYFPKGRSMGIYNQKQLNGIASKLNTRPRKTLGFKPPAEVFNDVLH